jgi:hypothetical protein
LFQAGNQDENLWTEIKLLSSKISFQNKRDQNIFEQWVKNINNLPITSPQMTLGENSPLEMPRYDHLERTRLLESTITSLKEMVLAIDARDEKKAINILYKETGHFTKEVKITIFLILFMFVGMMILVISHYLTNKPPEVDEMTKFMEQFKNS